MESINDEKIEIIKEFSDIINKLKCINEYKNIQTVLTAIYKDLEKTDLVKMFLSDEWNKYGYKFIKDNNGKKIKCKIFKNDLIKYSIYDHHIKPKEIPIYDVSLKNKDEYHKNKETFLAVFLNEDELIELPNYRGIFIDFIFKKISKEKYKVKVITEDVKDKVKLTQLNLYLRLEEFLCNDMVRMTSFAKGVFNFVKQEYVDKINEYKSMLSLINYALANDDYTLIVGKIKPIDYGIVSVKHFNTSEFLFRLNQPLNAKLFIRWDYLYLKQEIEKLLSYLITDQNTYSQPITENKIKLHITPTKLTELVIALIENQNFKKQDFESEKKLYNYLYEVFEIKSSNFETTKTKLRGRYKTDTFLTELDKSFKTAIQKLRDKQD